MSAITYVPIRTYATRAASDLNDIFNAINVGGTALTAANYAEEGLDASRFLTAQPTPWKTADGAGTANDRTDLATSAGWTNLTLGAINIATSGFSIINGDILRVRARVACESTVSSGVGLAGAMAGIAIAHTISGVTTRVTNTERFHTRLTTGSIVQHETLRTTYVRVAGGSVTFDALRVQYTHPDGAAGTFAPGSASIVATIFRRVT